jgi:ribose 5-phosphate isomerase A
VVLFFCSFFVFWGDRGILGFMNDKQIAAESAVELIHSDMIVGLGTGSTAEFFLVALAHAIRHGKLRNIRGVPTSRQSENRARELGIPLATLVQCPHPDIAIDGADEIDPELHLIKGLGGALLREKIVEQAARCLVIIADSSKKVSALGTKGPVPVEVAQFAHESHIPFFRSLGAEPTLRRNADDSPFVTDNGNYIYHLLFKKIEDPQKLERELKQHAGVVETGLFLNMAKIALISSPAGVERIQKK